jgi:hypothetical protein
MCQMDPVADFNEITMFVILDIIRKLWQTEDDLRDWNMSWYYNRLLQHCYMLYK